MTLLAKDTQGIWYQNDYLWDGRDKEFKDGGPWETLDETPDLTGFQQGLW